MRKIVIKATVALACLLLPDMSAVDAQTQLEMNAEAGKRRIAADAKLNVTYKRVISKFKGNAAFVQKLRTAEKAWIGFRDAYMLSIFPAEDKASEYGSVYPMCEFGWLAGIIDVRTKQLEQLIAAPASSSPETEFRKQEKLLNDTYQKALKVYPDKYLKVFRQSEVAFVTFRDADADAFASLAPAINQAKARFTWQALLDRQRSKELREWVDGTEEGNMCAGTIPVRSER